MVDIATRANLVPGTTSTVPGTAIRYLGTSFALSSSPLSSTLSVIVIVDVTAVVVACCRVDVVVVVVLVFFLHAVSLPVPVSGTVSVVVPLQVLLSYW